MNESHSGCLRCIWEFGVFGVFGRFFTSAVCDEAPNGMTAAFGVGFAVPNWVSLRIII